MGRNKASRRSGANNSKRFKLFSYQDIISNAHNKPNITIQERLQDMSLLHWNQPIDEALDLHLHGLLSVTGKALALDSWTKWPEEYCRAMFQLVQLVSAPQANALLTAKMAAIGRPDRSIGAQTQLLWLVVYEARVRTGCTASVIKQNGEIWRKWICCPHYKPLHYLKDEISNFLRLVLAAYDRSWRMKIGFWATENEKYVAKFE
jgi:hypothetical protein